MKIVVASNNRGKLVELQRLAHVNGIEFITAREAGLSDDFDVEETGTTFEENAALKASEYAKATGLYAIADDSGIEVGALGGEPGIYTKRFAGENATDAERIAFLLEKLKEIAVGQRAARFVAALALAAPDGTILDLQTGYCPGQIAFAPRGSHGFGYDPIFIVGNGERTMAELSATEKDNVSHRGNGLRLLRPKLLELVVDRGCYN
ncbi:MAG: RdgB/HAM1 family non-canonical purine NTP pyrophosphatase [Chloroflexi bacterium]|nr:RdgB/HAM1 family non-canonical purine NTP pyrophosphatase [Chloroflexota bacterium]